MAPSLWSDARVSGGRRCYLHRCTGSLSRRLSVAADRSAQRSRELAAGAYVWGVAPEFVYRFSNYNELVTAPRNTLGGGNAPAAWNNQGTNAGDASVLYMNAFLDLSGQKGRGGTKELVLTVPPSKNNYYVVNLLDGFINTMGSIGTRTTPSTRPQTYLLAGPTSRYAHKRIARIHGFTYRVMSFDTNLDWMLIRIRADSLVPASDPASAGVDQKARRRAIRAEHARQVRGARSIGRSTSSRARTRRRAAQIRRAAEVAQRPDARGRLLQADGRVAEAQPAPQREDRAQRHPAENAAELGRSAARRQQALPQPVVGPKAHAGPVQAARPHGERLQDPEQLGPKPDQSPPGRLRGRRKRRSTSYAVPGERQPIDQLLELSQTTTSGLYPNTPKGYLYRALPSCRRRLGQRGPRRDLRPEQQPRRHVGHPARRQQHLHADIHAAGHQPATLPVIGSLPPTVNDSQGNPRGFWSIPVYQTDTTQSAAPFITQASVLNTAYSTANIAVTAVDASTDTITVKPSAWGPLVASTPDPVRPDRGTVRPHTGRPVLRRDHPEAQARPDDKEHDVLVQGLDQVAAGAVRRQRADPRHRHAGSVRRQPDQPRRSGQPAVGTRSSPSPSWDRSS